MGRKLFGEMTGRTRKIWPGNRHNFSNGSKNVIWILSSILLGTHRKRKTVWLKALSYCSLYMHVHVYTYIYTSKKSR